MTRRQVAERTPLLPSELPSLSQKVVMSSPSVGVCKLRLKSHGSRMLKGRALSKDRLDDPMIKGETPPPASVSFVMLVVLGPWNC